MTVSEFTFLALGLALGVASGVAFIEIIRARPPARGEVRLTVAQDAVPRRRPATLADDAFAAVGPEPARGGPADRRFMDPQTPFDAEERRTNVQSQKDSGSAAGTSVPGAVPIRPDNGRVFRMGLKDQASGARPQAALVGIRVSSGEDPTLSDLRASNAAAAARAAAATTTAAATAVPAAAPPVAAAEETSTAATVATVAPPLSRTAVALLEPSPPSTSSTDGPPPASTDRCSEERRVADERCELATRARARADEAAEGLRAAQRTYESHESAAADAAASADPRTIQTAKEFAQRTFRAAMRTAKDPGALEAAARDWLHEINRINAHVREATATVARERGAASTIGQTLERLSREADVPRVAAEAAEAACTDARAALAECDERGAVRPAAFAGAAAPTAPAMDGLNTDETLGLAIEAGTAPRIFGMLRGDRAAMTTLVSQLSADDPERAPHWLRLLTALVDSIVADAIDASALIFPVDHPFWSKFSSAQARDIARALASIGCRFDGQGGWVDDHVPSQRDLSLAVGFASLDPMRVRRWPDAQAIKLLFSDVRVAADEYLANNAGDLTLAEMVTMLGRRADPFAELWNRWGTIRPLLLQNA